MSALFSLFSNNLLPIFLMAGAGFLLGKYVEIKPQTLSRVVFYIFSPCLIFDLLINNNLSNGDMLSMAAYTLVNMILMGGITWAFAKIMKLERKITVALVLAMMFMNAGNYGLSLNLFAFGEDALAHASIFFVSSAILMYTLGVTIASLGSSGLIESIKGLMKLPAVYAIAIALLFQYFSLDVPGFINRVTSTLADATIPTMLVLLGLQLQFTQTIERVTPVIYTSLAKLAGGATLAILTGMIFGFDAISRKAGILEASMPSAVMVTVLATEYDVEPAFVASVVVVSTLLSPLTLTPLLAYLGA